MRCGGLGTTLIIFRTQPIARAPAKGTHDTHRPTGPTTAKVIPAKPKAISCGSATDTTAQTGVSHGAKRKARANAISTHKGVGSHGPSEAPAPATTSTTPAPNKAGPAPATPRAKAARHTAKALNAIARHVHTVHAMSYKEVKGTTMPQPSC